MKQIFLSLLILLTGSGVAQPVSFNGYLLYDRLTSAIHPNGCTDDYVIGWPDDSTWVNMDFFSVMTGYFGSTRTDQPGNDLLLESSFHRDNYSVRLVLESGGFSASHDVLEADWTELPFVGWTHMFMGCLPGTAASPRWLLPLDFTQFGIGPLEVVTGIEITFLPTVGVPDFAGAYLLTPPCPEVDLGPDLTICSGESVNLDATNPGASYLWQDGSTQPIYADAGPGTYWVRVTLFSCIRTDTIHILSPEEPPPLGNDIQLCAGESAVLDVTTPGGIYQWQDQTTEPSFTVSQSGIYAVTVTVGTCVFTDQIQVEVTDPPPVNLGDDMILCEGETFTLDAFFPGASYQWQDLSTSSSYLVTGSGAYSVTVTLSGCSAEDVILVDYMDVPSVDLGNDLDLCEGETIVLDAFTTGATYLWQDLSTGSGFHVTAPGIYSVTVTVDECSISDEIGISYIPLVSFDLGPDTVLCFGSTLLLDATTPGATYQWQDQSSAATFLVNAAGQYFVQVTYSGCEVADTIEITFANTFNLNIGVDTQLCIGETLVLYPGIPGAIYQWQDQSTADSFLVTQAGTYYVQASLGSCVASDTIAISYSTLTVPDLGSDTLLCEGETLLLQVSSPNAFLEWHDQTTGPTWLVEMPGTYWVTATANGCALTDTIHITYTSLPAVYLGPDTILCEGETITLDATFDGSTYMWQDQSTSPDYLVSTPGSYWVDVRLGNCHVSDTLLVQYDPSIELSLGNDTTLCEGQHMTLDATIPGTQYQWQDGSTLPTFTVTGPGTYWVHLSAGVCTTDDTIQIIYQPIPWVDLGPDTTLCEGEVLLLQAGHPGNTYNWQDQSVLPAYLVTTGGLYSVTASDGLCADLDSIYVAYLDVAAIPLGPDTTLCPDQSLVLHAHAPGAELLWQDHSTLATFEVSDPGTYWVEARLEGCYASDTIVVDYHPPVILDLGKDTILCPGETLMLTAEITGAQYTWQDMSSSASYEVIEEGQYWVLANVFGCHDSDTIEVKYVAFPSVILGNDTSRCEGETLLLHLAIPDAQYLWQDHSTSSDFLVSTPGIYSVQVFLNPCKIYDTISIEYIIPVYPDLGEDQLLCEGEEVILSPDLPEGLTLLWQDHSMENTYTVSVAGTYWIQIADDCGLRADTVNIGFTSCDQTNTIYVPNIFSPNGDGINDLFRPVSNAVFTSYLLRVYDRYGGLLFETSTLNNGWDGTVRDALAQSGVYAYVLEYTDEDGKPERLVGDITLIR